MKKVLKFTLILVLGICLIIGCGKENENDNNTKDGEKTPSVTVNSGDVVFDNNVLKIVYKEVKIDSTSMDIYYEVTNKSNEDIYVQHRELVYNGTIKNAPGVGQANFASGKTDDNVIVMYLSAIESQAGISPEEIKTVQVTFDVHSFNSDKTLFNGTALLNIQLP